ncbi:MAG: hypothetical protein ACKVOW_13155 [Chitinophagaceae bacterium]
MKSILFLLVCFVAVTTSLSGIIMIVNSGGELLNLPLNLLNNTPFKNFLIPGILLTLVVGGTNLIAVFQNMQRSTNRYNLAIAGGLLISGWIIVQMILIQTFHWLQFVFLGTGFLIILIAYQLKGKWAV